MNDPVVVAGRFHEALAGGASGEALRAFLAPSMTFIEHPNAINPLGGTIGIEQVLAGSVAGAQLLAEQRFDLHDARVWGDTAVLRLTWTGRVASDRGPFTADQVLRARVAQFVTVRDGRIVRLESYDCYEPFDRASRSKAHLTEPDLT